MTKIKEIDYAIAFRIRDTIYLNKNLKKYPKLKKAILQHEKNHESNSYCCKDLKLDLTGKYLFPVKKDYYKFLFTERKAWMQMMPIIKINKCWVFDPILIGLWVFAFALIGMIIILS